MDINKLKEPFSPVDIEWRIQSSGLKASGLPWGKAFAYVQNRAIQERLDDVCGAFWCNEFKQGPGGGVLCGISILIDDGWVTRWDGAENPDFEPVKGGLSNAMKRAAVQWGMGRYLYKLEIGWADFNESGKYKAKVGDSWFSWDPPPLPEWAFPKGELPKVVTKAQHDAIMELLESASFNTGQRAASWSWLDTKPSKEEAEKKLIALRTRVDKYNKGVQND